ncbi:MAG: DNA topoisomerase I [Candidatus Bathyarchaeia archaeon]
MKSLIHNGVLIPNHQPIGLVIKVKGQKIRLNAEQEEMAIAWVKKLGTKYAKDRAFVKNFFKDFKNALRISENLPPEEFDFSEVIAYLEREKRKKETMSKEEKKLLAQERKAIKEANKAKYGYAIVDGECVEIANYTVEPSSIFMGRGKHPLRGRWKPGPKQEDIILNLSPDAPRPSGNWKEIVWQPDAMWIACWRDKLTGKMKYVWLADSAPLKQNKEIEKFEKAKELEKYIDIVRSRIWSDLSTNDEKLRKVATVCYLIDLLKFRVGDEKDKDEADTVGATTLRKEHINIHGNLVEFNFLGKDCVRWKKRATLSNQVLDNLKRYIKMANDVVFDGISSEDVNRYLSEIMPGLTAKVFRTYHATRVVREFLEKSKVKPESPEWLKKEVATMANLQAAIECNHKKTMPKNWKESLRKKIQRLKELRKKKMTKKRKEAVQKLRSKIRLMQVTKGYNLNTSLKSYIDPRVYYEWGKKINFDWKNYYPKSLHKKFEWIENEKTFVRK